MREARSSHSGEFRGSAASDFLDAKRSEFSFEFVEFVS